MEFQVSLFVIRSRKAAAVSSINTRGLPYILDGLLREAVNYLRRWPPNSDFVHINDVVAANMRVLEAMTRTFNRYVAAVIRRCS